MSWVENNEFLSKKCVIEYEGYVALHNILPANPISINYRLITYIDLCM